MRASGELAAFVERVRLAASRLSDIAAAASAVGPDLVEAIRATLAEVDRRLDSSEIVAALAGDAAEKRTLLNAVVGARAFDPAASPQSDAVVTLRANRSFDYTAHTRDGSVVEFGWRMPPREESFAKAQQRAEAEREAAHAAEQGLRERLDGARREAAEGVLAPRSKPPSALRRLWTWVLRLLGSLFAPGRARLAPSLSVSGADAARPSGGEVPALAQSLAEARARLQQATTRVEALRTERPKYDQERAEAFIQDVRALTDHGARGHDVVSLSIACPTALLPADVVLVDAASPPDSADGVILAAMGNGGAAPAILAELEAVLRPARVHVVAKLGELAGALDRIRAEQPVVAATRAAAAVRACVVRVTEESGRAEANCRRRIDALESQRIPDPAEFRARQMIRVTKAVEDGAREVQTRAVERLRAAVALTKEEWRAGVLSCATREQMESFVRTIDASAEAHVQAMVDDVGHHAVLELQHVSESIQTWLLEEIRARYHVMRAIEQGEASGAVVGGEIAIATIHRPPLASALDKFEGQRVGLGLGGVAAGAVVGTLIVPGIGTAIGAFVGAFAGLLKGLDSLKKECIARLDRCLDDVQQSVAEQIVGRQAFAGELRASLDDAFDDALAQLESTISRLMALERRVLEDERKKREDLVRLRAMLEENVLRISAPSSARGAV